MITEACRIGCTFTGPALDSNMSPLWLAALAANGKTVMAAPVAAVVLEIHVVSVSYLCPYVA